MTRPLDSYAAFEKWLASMDWPMAVFLSPTDFREVCPRYIHLGLDPVFGEYFCSGYTRVFSKPPSGKIMDFSQGIPGSVEGIF